MADRIEWPSGLVTAEDMMAGAGRIEQQLNANGDPIYIGYAPKTTAESHLPGWLIELRIYNGSNKLIGQYRTVQYSWNDRTLLVKPPISPAPVFGQVSIAGTALPGIYYKRGGAVGQVSLSALMPLPVVICRARAIGAITLAQFMPYYAGEYQGGFLAWKNKNRASLISPISVTALALGNPWKAGTTPVGQIKVLAIATGTQV